MLLPCVIEFRSGIVWPSASYGHRTGNGSCPGFANFRKDKQRTLRCIDLIADVSSSILTLQQRLDTTPKPLEGMTLPSSAHSIDSQYGLSGSSGSKRPRAKLRENEAEASPERAMKKQKVRWTSFALFILLQDQSGQQQSEPTTSRKVPFPLSLSVTRRRLTKKRSRLTRLHLHAPRQGLV